MVEYSQLHSGIARQILAPCYINAKMTLSSYV